MAGLGDPEGDLIAPLGDRDLANYYWSPRHFGEGDLQPISTRVRQLLPLRKQEGWSNEYPWTWYPFH